MTEKKASFDDEKPLQSKGSKLDPSKSQFKQKNTRKDFFERADQTMSSVEDKRQRAFDLTKQFWESIKDTTLPENKGPLKKTLEKELAEKLISYAIEVNGEIDVTDVDGNVIGKEHEGMGSVSMIALILKVLMYQRDINNKLQFKVSELETKLNSLLK